jgi:hypothetical protein
MMLAPVRGAISPFPEKTAVCQLLSEGRMLNLAS